MTMLAFLNKDEIIYDLISRQLSKADQEEIKKIPEKDLIMYHHSLGQFIRNHYQLWNPNNPHTLQNYQEMLEDRNGVFVDVNPKHPDSFSMEIIEELWKKLNTASAQSQQHKKMLRSL